MPGADMQRPPSTDAQRRAAFRDALGEGALADLFRYWEAKAAGAAMPPAGAIDATEIPRLLPVLYMLEPTGLETYRFRLAGTGVRELFDAEVTGRTLDEVLPTEELRENARRSYAIVRRDGRPWLTDMLYELENGGTFRYRRLALPLGQDGEVTRVLGAFALGPADGPDKPRLPFHRMLPSIVRTLDRRELAG